MWFTFILLTLRVYLTFLNWSSPSFPMQTPHMRRSLWWPSVLWIVVDLDRICCCFCSIIETCTTNHIGAESDQHVNICSFAVHCDRRWPSTQWHRVYTSSSNVPYVQFESVGDFIPEPRCSKFAVGLQTRRRKMGGTRGSVGLWSKGLRVTGANCWCRKWPTRKYL